MDRVLYMEDDAAQARLAKLALERAGYTVDVAATRAKGIEFFGHEAYDALVVDQAMPGMSGLDVIHAIAENGPLPPTIMVTGAGDEQIAVKAMKAGAADYLVKDGSGCFIEILPLAVHRAIEERRTLLEKRRIERELAQAGKMRTIGQLAVGIAHEINTPAQYIAANARFLQDAFTNINRVFETYDRLLQAVRSNEVTDALVEDVEREVNDAEWDYLSTEIPQAIQQSLEGVEHVAQIVGAVRDASHPHSDQKHLIDLNHAVENAIVLCGNEWKPVADIVVDLDSRMPYIPCSPGDIDRVIVNLLVNAAHATAEATHDGRNGKRPIVLRTRHEDGWAEIRVEDAGVGIPEQYRDQIFEPFFTTKEVGKGTGQGLAIAQAIVVAGHGGTIRFETKTGHGTTFIVRLPCPAPAAVPVVSG